MSLVDRVNFNVNLAHWVSSYVNILCSRNVVWSGRFNSKTLRLASDMPSHEHAIRSALPNALPGPHCRALLALAQRVLVGRIGIERFEHFPIPLAFVDKRRLAACRAEEIRTSLELSATIGLPDKDGHQRRLRYGRT